MSMKVNETTTYQINQLLIHSSDKVWYFNRNQVDSGNSSGLVNYYGYGQFVELGNSDSLGKVRVTTNSIVENRPIESQTAGLNWLRRHSDIELMGSTHLNGTNPICIFLKVGKFELTSDSRFRFRVIDAHTCKYPNISPFDNTRTIYRRKGSGIVSAKTYRDFKYPVTVYACLYVDGDHPVMVKLFEKPRGVTTWSENQYKATNVTLTTAVPIDSSSSVQVAILVQSQCTCDQGTQSGFNAYRPVFVDDISDLIPERRRYIWRKFGTSRDDDKAGYDIDPNLLDGRWHLVRPVYVKKSSGWEDIDE